MTTNVTIEAHVGPNKQVSIILFDQGSDKLVEETLLQDGQTKTLVVYDHLEISVMEIQR